MQNDVYYDYNFINHVSIYYSIVINFFFSEIISLFSLFYIVFFTIFFSYLHQKTYIFSDSKIFHVFSYLSYLNISKSSYPLYKIYHQHIIVIYTTNLYLVHYISCSIFPKLTQIILSVYLQLTLSSIDMPHYIRDKEKSW